jgi:peptidoglycan-N-acetylglucosamine deacetylase
MSPNTVVTTSWDDGHVLDLRVAELLERYGVGGTFYVAPRSRELSVRSRLSVGELRSLGERFEIGGHTLTHPRLPALALGQATEEIRRGKDELEHMLGSTLHSFAYPGGAYDERHVALVRDAGFKVGRTVRRHVTHPATDPLQMDTTVHAYRHWSDGHAVARSSGWRLADSVRRFWNWDRLAMAMFDRVRERGGVFHLWGHSWEIDAHEDWLRLDRVLAYVGGRRDATYVANGAVALPEGNSEAGNVSS